MRTAMRLLAGAAAAATLSGLGITAAHATTAGIAAPTQAETCRYVVDVANPIPVRSGPGKKYRAVGELGPSKDPIAATCAARGRGPSHWVQLKEGDHEGEWVWRNRLQPWSG